MEKGRNVADFLSSSPWLLPRTAQSAERHPLAHCRFFAPARLVTSAVPDISPFTDLRDLLAQTYHQASAHLFIGATGIAVRVLAPLLRHKSLDPPVLVMDPCGKYVISLLSGHWGGGNALSRHLAQGLGARPVITTASDNTGYGEGAVCPDRALDIFLRDSGLLILDWDHLPRTQAALLEKQELSLWDPTGLVPRPWPSWLHEISGDSMPQPSGSASGIPMLTAHCRALPPRPDILRITRPCLWIGLGCKYDIPQHMALQAIRKILHEERLEPKALAGLATITDKIKEAALLQAAEGLRLPLRHFSAPDLAACPVLHPSTAAGKRFGQRPFSVCEAAALLAAGKNARLLLPKMALERCLTIAIAQSTSMKVDR